MAQKVVRAGVFIKPPDQIADGAEEVLLVADRGIEQQAGGFLEEGTALVVGHAFQHFKLHAVHRLVFPREHEGVGDIEEIVGGYAQLHGGEILRQKTFVDHAFKIGIGLRFGLERSLWPAFD